MKITTGEDRNARFHHHSDDLSDPVDPIWVGSYDMPGIAYGVAVTGTLAQAALPWVSLVATVPMAIGLELAQKRIPNRSYNRVELIANVLGVLLIAAVALAQWRQARAERARTRTAAAG